MRHSHIELNQAFVDRVGADKAAEFGDALVRAHDRLDERDHDRARDLVVREAQAVGIDLAPPEAGSLADQLLRFDRIDIHAPGTRTPEVDPER
ncbi:hypothetical protein [Mobilicoccus caccae]|uniref:Uncharacterized protein n=1 Tax=Mobilicoccus caccae TaxID=1859295 RepID=A0ABQ6IYU2_9MICO|nr:hypothetical protein [Mobilicoccus caccae]GMA42241.1 hypothetical protein GCM10025883_42860 [Mobilicoccus caccae]